MASISSQSVAAELGSTASPAISAIPLTSTQSPTSPSSPSSRRSRNFLASGRTRINTTASLSSPTSSHHHPHSPLSPASTISPTSAVTTSTNETFANLDSVMSPSTGSETSSNDSDIQSEDCPANCEHCLSRRVRIFDRVARYRMLHPDHRNAIRKVAHRLDRTYDGCFAITTPNADSNELDDIVLSDVFRTQLDGYKRRIREDDVWAPLRALWMRPLVEDDVVIDEILVMGTEGFYDASTRDRDPTREMQLWFWEKACVAVLAEMIAVHTGAASPPAVKFYSRDPEGFEHWDQSIFTAMGDREGQGSVWQAKPGSESPCPSRTSFVWAAFLPVDETFWHVCAAGEEAAKNDPGVSLWQQAELLFDSYNAYAARVEKMENSDDETVDVETAVIEYLRHRKYEETQGVELPDLVPPQHGGSNPLRLFSGAYLYWRPRGGEAASLGDTDVRAIDEILVAAKTIRQTSQDKALASAEEDRVANGLGPMSQEDKRRFLDEDRALNAAYDLDQVRSWDNRCSRKFRSKFAMIRSEIRNSGEWAAQRGLLLTILDDPACRDLNKVVLIGSQSFAHHVREGFMCMNVWFYCQAWTAVVVDLVTEKQGNEVQWLVEHGDEEHYFMGSKGMFDALGARLLRDHEVQQSIDENTIVINLNRGSNLEFVAESFLTSPPAIYMGQRLEYLLHADPEPATFPSSSFDKKAAAIAFLQSHESDNLPPFERDYLIRTGMEEAAPQDNTPADDATEDNATEDNATEDDAPKDGAPEDDPSEDDDPEEEWNLNAPDEAIYWPSRKHDVDVDALMKKFSRALLLRYDDDESDEDGEDEDGNNWQDDETREDEVDTEEGGKVGAEEQEYDNSEEGGEVELGKQDADDNEADGKTVKNKQE